MELSTYIQQIMDQALTNGVELVHFDLGVDPFGVVMEGGSNRVEFTLKTEAYLLNKGARDARSN